MELGNDGEDDDRCFAFPASQVSGPEGVVALERRIDRFTRGADSPLEGGRLVPIADGRAELSPGEVVALELDGYKDSISQTNAARLDRLLSAFDGRVMHVSGSFAGNGNELASVLRNHPQVVGVSVLLESTSSAGPVDPTFALASLSHLQLLDASVAPVPYVDGSSWEGLEAGPSQATIDRISECTDLRSLSCGWVGEEVDLRPLDALDRLRSLSMSVGNASRFRPQLPALNTLQTEVVPGPDGRYELPDLDGLPSLEEISLRTYTKGNVDTACEQVCALPRIRAISIENSAGIYLNFASAPVVTRGIRTLVRSVQLRKILLKEGIFDVPGEEIRLFADLPLLDSLTGVAPHASHDDVAYLRTARPNATITLTKVIDMPNRPATPI